MANVLSLPTQPPAKFGFARVRRRKKPDPERHGQLNLFSESARIVSLPARLSPFEEALHVDGQDDAQARTLYGKAISAGDCVADAYCNLGILESKQGLTEEAFNCFAESLAEDPRHLESHFNLGNLYFDIEDMRLAREHYEIAARIAPTFANVYFNLGLALATAGDLKGAISALGKYRELVSGTEGCKADDLLHNLQHCVSARG